MDENYLDNLLNELSLDSEIDHKIEDELDNQIKAEKQEKKEANTMSEEEVFDFGLDQDIIGSEDPLDFDFSEEQIDELDQLDDLADLDIGDLDFSDIDFDDLDITKLDDIGGEDFDDLLKEFEGDLEVDDFFDSGTKEEETDILPEENPLVETEESAFDFGADSSEPSQEPELGFSASVEPEEADREEVLETNDDLNEDAFDASQFLDSLLDEAEEAEANQEPITELPEEPETSEAMEETPVDFSEEPEQDLEALLREMEADAAMDASEPEEQPMEKISPESLEEIPNPPKEKDEFTQMIENTDVLEQEDLDDLLSMLDMEEKGGASASQNAGDADLSDSDMGVAMLDDIPELEDKPSDEAKKKKTLTQILFGEPDEEDELSEEELAAIEAKKAAKKEKKQAAKEEKAQKKEEKKAQKSASDSQKKKDTEEKKRVKAEKKAKQKAEAIAEAANEKKLNRPMVFFIFTVFLGGVLIFFVFTTDFNYKLAIEKAANYFASQKYHKAYDEIKGVDVKEPDKELKDRIYTVMYVERLYEAYETNLSMKREEKALDSLLRGVSKYYEHYEEAQELGIVSDIDFSFSRIQNALLSRYGITVEQAVEINQLENWEYVQRINAYAEGAAPVVEEEAPGDSKEQEPDENSNTPEDAMLPEEEEE